MTTTPTVWKSEFEIGIGGRLGQVVSDVGAGRFIVVREDGSSGLRGQIFDAEGNPIGGILDLNSQVATGSSAKVAKLKDGGFALAYQSISPDEHSIVVVETFDINGERTGKTTIDGHQGVFMPDVAVRSDGSLLVVYSAQVSDDKADPGDADVFGRVIETNGAVGAEFTVVDNAVWAHNPDIAALKNGNFVIGYRDYSSEDAANPAFQVISATGEVLTGSIAADVYGRQSGAVAALENGDFVVVWNGVDGVEARLYAENGAPRGPAFPVDMDSGFFVGVVPLAAGGFIVGFNTGNGFIRTQRFDDNGTTVGEDFRAVSEEYGQLATLGDGRIVVIGGDFDRPIQAVILDPRGTIIEGTEGNDVLTSRMDGATVYGKGGNDTLLGQKAKDTIHGEAGNDIISGGLAKDKLWGHQGRDTFVFDSKLGKGNVDKIKDFKPNKDMVLLDEDIFKKVGAKLSKKEFMVGKKAADKNDFVIHNKKKGVLLYDKNGDKKGGAKAFAKVDKGLKLDHKDFVVDDFVI